MSHSLGAPHSHHIVVDGDPVLRATAEAVLPTEFNTAKLRTIIATMSKALRDEPYGVGIAAPQIGISKRIFLVRGFVLANMRRDDAGADKVEDKAFINPSIVRRSKKKVAIEGEGCLSVPEVYGTVMRSTKVTVRAQDETGKKFERGGADVLAEIFEHECEHLDGILFIDHATDIHSRSHE